MSTAPTRARRVDQGEASAPQRTSHLPLPTSPARPNAFHLTPAGAGDHPALHRLLINVLHAPSSGEFHSQLEDPFYEPSDRLLIKRDERLASHLLLVKREIQFGSLTIPVSELRDLATAPEFCRLGLATALLEAADRQMLSDGADLGMLCTNNVRFFLNRGWTVAPRHCYSTASARDILSYLNARTSTRRPRFQEASPTTYNIRLWRHVEHEAIQRLYQQNTAQAYGAIVRSDAYWRWLIGRHAFDRIYVAIDGPDKFDLDDSLSRIVGYAVMKRSRIVEMMTSPEHPDAGPQLLARACGDAIERDYHPMRVDAPANSELHQLVTGAGGEFCGHEADSGVAFMCKLFRPLEMLERLGPQLVHRAKAAKLPASTELGVLYEGEKYRLVVTRRTAKLKPGKLGRSYLVCGQAALTQMLLGHIAPSEAVKQRRMEASTRVAVDLADALFPRLPFWRPAFDDLVQD